MTVVETHCSELQFANAFDMLRLSMHAVLLYCCLLIFCSLLLLFIFELLCQWLFEKEI